MHVFDEVRVVVSTLECERDAEREAVDVSGTDSVCMKLTDELTECDNDVKDLDVESEHTDDNVFVEVCCIDGVMNGDTDGEGDDENDCVVEREAVISVDRETDRDSWMVCDGVREVRTDDVHDFVCVREKYTESVEEKVNDAESEVTCVSENVHDGDWVAEIVTLDVFQTREQDGVCDFEADTDKDFV